eukprot:6206826-Pleurochrysis_carterae.AAC.1
MDGKKHSSKRFAGAAEARAKRPGKKLKAVLRRFSKTLFSAARLLPYKGTTHVAKAAYVKHGRNGVKNGKTAQRGMRNSPAVAKRAEPTDLHSTTGLAGLGRKHEGRCRLPKPFADEAVEYSQL